MSDEQMSTRRNEANDIVTKYIKWSAGAGIIPIPFLDSLAVSAVQFKMLKSLADLYDLEFKGELVKTLMASLLGGLSSRAIASGARQAVKAIPGIGSLLGMLAMPASSAALSYALGAVFIKHFELGGTFLNFDPDSTREYFREVFVNKKDTAPQQTIGVNRP